MSGTFTREDMQDALRSQEQQLAQSSESETLERVARTRRWLDMGAQQPLFREAATQIEQGLVQSDFASPSIWAAVGGLWHLAGDKPRAHRALRTAIAGGTFWEPEPVGAAGVLYLLGEFDGAQELAGDYPEGWIAAGARDRDIEQIRRARESWLGWERLARSGPHSYADPIPLSAWDWIEETHRLEAELRGEPVPTHLEMLRRSGLLRKPDEAIPTPPPRPAPRQGYRATLDGKDLPRLEVINHDAVEIELDPGRFLDLKRYRPEEGWGARLAKEASSGQWILSPCEPEFQAAALWAAAWLTLHREPQAADAVRRLVAMHDALG
jgi:hypothetical protein